MVRYFEILEGVERARYLETKSICVDVDLEADDKTLWQAHDSASASRVAGSGGDVSLLAIKTELAERMLRKCGLCERMCGANRFAGEKGLCGVLEPRVNAEFLHMGEEPDLVPSHTIFFAGCTFNCVYCQNWDISTNPAAGVTIGPSDLARKIEQRADRRGGLSSRVSRNVNWVGGDPTSNLPYILKVLKECRANIPQVWNSNMYLSKDAMRLLSGVVDIYLTDYKYGNDTCALRLSNVKDYTRIIQRNHLLGRSHAEMIVRHLVLPGHIDCCTRPALKWIAENLHDVKVNVMAQYRPEYKAEEFPDLNRPLRASEYEKAFEIAEVLHLDLCD